MTVPWSFAGMWRRLEEIEAAQAEAALADERWEIVEPASGEEAEDAA